ncbi:hypothetical protein LUZ63_020589 [Rhynchospora breviuscula]|uniref:Copper oxidase n=1 Tax=Rhynchospora breviuscula TaxID=2022672 RepID=A0A9P9Z9E1_9POAL|nr:hypothetical protein LUZ63_020589 [Rhynchospora breviuscula]
MSTDDHPTTDPTSPAATSRPRPPALTRRRVLLAGGGTVLAAGAAAGVDRLAGGNGSLGLLGPDSTPIGPHSPEVLAAERARTRTGRVVRRTLTPGPTTLDLAGRQVDTWAFNATAPATEIRLSSGDNLRLDLHNQLPDPTTVHWHGLALRNDMDGVPGLTMDAVAPGERFDYDFTAPHPGTYWFHPHVGVQLDTGLLGALVIEDPREPLAYDVDAVLVLDDWTDGLGRSPKAILAEQARDGMGSMGSMSSGGSLSATGTATRAQPIGEDTGDVTYPLHLVNGRPPADPYVVHARPGQRLRIRLINAGSDTAYRVAVGGHRLDVVAADGFPVEPVTVDTVLLGMGERYDVLLTADAGAFPIVSRPEGKQDPTGLAVLRTTDTARTPRAEANELDGRLLAYTDLTPTPGATLPPGRPDREHDLSLRMADGGRRWLINGRTYADREPLDVRPGERVRLRMENRSTMFHPMHLHGHTFALSRGARPGVRKDTINVVPRQRLDVDLVADNPGQWLVHCHNAYHGELGMMTSLSYVR